MLLSGLITLGSAVCLSLGAAQALTASQVDQVHFGAQVVIHACGALCLQIITTLAPLCQMAQMTSSHR